MQKILLMVVLAYLVSYTLEAQLQPSYYPYRIDDSKRQITLLENGKYEIKEFTQNDVPAYIGNFSSIVPMVRDGEFKFFDLYGDVITSGYYKDDIPVGEWIYTKSNKDTLRIIDYQLVWDFLLNEDEIIAYDTAAMESLSKKSRKLMKEGGIFEEVDELPLFDGEMFFDSYGKYLNDNMILPVYAEKNNIKDAAFIEFTVDYMGNIRKPVVLQSGLSDLSLEAMRVLLESSEKWEAAKIEDTPVNVRFSLEFSFDDARSVFHHLYDLSIINEDSSGLKEFAYGDSVVHYIVDQMPLFNNGDPASEFIKFIISELDYPVEAAEKGYQGRVIVQFMVDSLGAVRSPLIVKGAHPLLDSEAIRVIMASPHWTPGRLRGRAVNVMFTFPINFKL